MFNFNPFKKSSKIEKRSGMGKTAVFLVASGIAILASQEASGQTSVTELTPAQAKEYLAKHPDAKRVSVSDEKTAKEQAAEWGKRANVDAKDYGGGVRLSGRGAEVTGDDVGEREHNPTMNWVEGDPLPDQHEMLLGHYQARGVAKGITPAQFEDAYRNRDTDPRFNNWAHEYAAIVNKPIPPGRVEDLLTIKPLILLSKTEADKIPDRQTENYDLLPFAKAFDLAEKAGLDKFDWKVGQPGGGTFRVTHNPDDVKGTVPGFEGGGGSGSGWANPGDGGPKGGIDPVPSDGMPRGGTTTTKTTKWVESVKPTDK